MLAPLDARLDVAIRWRGAALDQLLDERHARLCGLVARRLRQMGYETRVEVTYSIYGERGSVDVIGWRPADRALVIVEVKVDIGSAEGTVRKHDEKQRLARTIARERFGGEPRVVVGLLVVADGTTSRRRIDRHEEVFGPAYPSRGRSAWALAEHGVAGRGLAFLPVTANAGKRRPATRRPAA